MVSLYRDGYIQKSLERYPGTVYLTELGLLVSIFHDVNLLTSSCSV